VASGEVLLCAANSVSVLVAGALSASDCVTAGDDVVATDVVADEVVVDEVAAGWLAPQAENTSTRKIRTKGVIFSSQLLLVTFALRG
jgi:hypothetical protein